MGKSAPQIVVRMHLVFNELSLFPLCDSLQVAEDQFSVLVDTFRKANGLVGFKKIMFPSSFSNYFVVEQVNVAQFIGGIKNKNLRELILSFFSPPYLDDLDAIELNAFYSGEYQVIGEACPTKEPPYGLPVAHIKSVPTISLNTHPFWENRQVSLARITSEGAQDEIFSVCNISRVSHLEAEESKFNEFDEWWAGRIESCDELCKFLRYEKYIARFEEAFFSQLMEWKRNDEITYRHILRLMRDVEPHPFAGGLGKTENLKNLGKEAAKRISQRDRLSYSIENDQVLFIACKGHYDFHF